MTFIDLDTVIEEDGNYFCGHNTDVFVDDKKVSFLLSFRYDAESGAFTYTNLYQPSNIEDYIGKEVDLRVEMHNEYGAILNIFNGKVLFSDKKEYLSEVEKDTTHEWLKCDPYREITSGESIDPQKDLDLICKEDESFLKYRLEFSRRN